MVYELRESKPGTRIPLRDRDLDAPATALGSDPEVVETRLVELMDVTREEAAAMRAALVRRRILVPAASIAIGASTVVGGAKLVGGDASGDAKTAVVQAPDTAGIRIGTAAAVTTAQPAIGDAISVAREVPAPVPAVDAAPADPAYVERTPGG